MWYCCRTAKSKVINWSSEVIKDKGAWLLSTCLHLMIVCSGVNAHIVYIDSLSVTILGKFTKWVCLYLTLSYWAGKLEINWTGSTRQEKSTRALKGTSVIKWVNKMTGKQHVIQKTMIIIFKLKLFSMFLLQNPSSQLPKWGDGENWKVYYFVNNLHWLQAQSTWKILHK